MSSANYEDTFPHDGEDSPTQAGGIESLTPRQREVLALIGQGLSTAEIAARLFRTVKTIESHRLMLGKRLGARNRVELARMAIQAGLVNLGTSARAETSVPASDEPQASRNVWAVIEAGATAETGEEFLCTLASKLVAGLDASAVLIVRAGVDGTAESVVGRSERGDMEPIRYPLEDAEDAGMTLGEVRVLDGVPAVMLAKVTDLAVLRCSRAFLTALHDSRGHRLGTLAVLLKSAYESSVECEQVMRVLAGRVSAELERKESDDRFRHLQTLLTNAAERIGLWERNLRNDEVTWSSQTYRILGFEPNQVPATGERFLSMVHPDDRPRVESAYASAARRCSPAEAEFRVFRLDGCERRLVACCETSPDATGRPGWLLGTIRDVTTD